MKTMRIIVDQWRLGEWSIDFPDNTYINVTDSDEIRPAILEWGYRTAKYYDEEIRIEVEEYITF